MRVCYCLLLSLLCSPAAFSQQPPSPPHASEPAAPPEHPAAGSEHPTQPATPHPFTVQDWATLHSARAVAVAPDGRSILYRVGYGATSGPSKHESWLIHPDGTGAAKLEPPEEFTPEGFLRDGNALYGEYKLNDQPQLGVFPLSGSRIATAPSAVVVLPRGIHTVIPSPDGQRFALLADPRAPDPLDKTRTVIEPDQTSLYVVKTDGTEGKWWCPALKSVSGAEGSQSNPIAWSPDSASIAVLSQLPKIGYHSVRSFIDVCTASGSRHLAEIPNSTGAIAWSEEASAKPELVVISTANPVLTPDHVWSVPAAGGQPADRTPKLDGTAVALATDPRGRTWVQINRGVRSEVDEWRGGALVPAYTWPSGCLAGLPAFAEYAGASDQLAFTVGDPAHAPNVAVPQGTSLHRITGEGDTQLSAITLGNRRTVRWTSKEGIALEGIVTFPAGYVEGRKYPFLVLPHGGPEANDLLEFDPVADIIAGFGYVVLQPQYRGSTGYGDDFLSAIYQHFGDRAYRDVDSGTDYAIAQGWADPARLAIFGWSAGGFMTSWTVTQTGRYRAAAEGAGITDWGSFIFTSDVQQTDFDARWPEENPEDFRRFSAVDFAAKVTTPLLILHGEADVRVPTYQGREFFEVLAARGKTVRMVTYPGSPHFPRLWEQRIDVFNAIREWLSHYNP